ncbi:hypothetical protein, partial [Lancefieldella rimae]|uniref:hypothetical protein n=1 Tax=Lancefieldella rimae TaxID=1383 RepID=UPI003A8EC0F2
LPNLQQVWFIYTKLAASLAAQAILGVILAALFRQYQLAAILAVLTWWHYLGSANLAALFRQYQLGAVPAAPLWHQITNVLTNTTSVLLALLPKTHR